MADVAFSTLPAATPTMATELETVQAGVWKKFPLSAIPVATTDAAGLMSAADKTALANAQPLDADLTTIAGLTATTDSFMQAKSGAWAARTVAQVKADLGLSGTNSGDQTITLTGDVTGSGAGSFAATIAANAVTTTKILDGTVTAAKLADTAVTPGSYTNASVTVDAQGRVTAASSGSGGVLEYSALTDVARVTATGAGITFVKTDNANWAFTIPEGVTLLSWSIYTATGTGISNTLSLAFNYTNNSTFNQNNLTARPPRGIHVLNWGTSSPLMGTASGGSTSATTSAIKCNILTPSSGSITAQFSNYTTAAGTGASTLYGGF